VQVESCDVAEAFRLLEVSLQQSATDHATGKSYNFLDRGGQFTGDHKSCYIGQETCQLHLHR
jgi:hypothetical protein